MPGEDFMKELAAPARRALEGAGLTSLKKLARKTEEQVAELHGMGPNSLAKLRTSLKKEGLRFK